MKHANTLIASLSSNGPEDAGKLKRGSPREPKRNGLRRRNAFPGACRGEEKTGGGEDLAAHRGGGGGGGGEAKKKDRGHLSAS